MATNISGFSKVWRADGLSQEELMAVDEVIEVDFNDNITGHGSKKDTHIFNAANPRGRLHRAFSVFLFNSKGQLLLQQRAAEKITFPNVWTNTCCSHPLFGCSPNEVDKEADVALGKVDGIKAAAVRKLDQELGIKGVKASDFKYLTRLHYWAADVVTHGPQSPWGENEIDFILFVKTDVEIKPHPEEVRNTKYVTYPELLAMMKDSKNLWSPWFRIITEKFLSHWWKDLDLTIKTDDFVDYKTIYRFDPTAEHMGGAGNARDWLGSAASPYETRAALPVSHPSVTASGSSACPFASSAGTSGNNTEDSRPHTADSKLKQGGYGKVKIHKHSLIGQLLRPVEVYSALNVLLMASDKRESKSFNKDVAFCNDMLGKVSRSFASVIRQLPSSLRVDITVFYLALRALDTIEDDMEAFKGKEDQKITHLQNFYKTALVVEGWSMEGVGEGDERVLLEKYYHCVAAFRGLPESSQEIIADIARRMGEGMASFVSRDLGQGTKTIEDYYLYCHYVAGLVGEGLSRLFTSTGYESQAVAAISKTLANTMGLFLQKTNIIRDFLEDYVDGRTFWPETIWKQYTSGAASDLGELATPEARGRAVECLNHMIADVLRDAPECLEYMELIKTEEIFKFVAIPQVMAIATISELFNNPKVFTGVVKIRKGLACKLILEMDSPNNLHASFNYFAKSIKSRVRGDSVISSKIRAACDDIITITAKSASSVSTTRRARFSSLFLLLAIAAVAYISSSYPTYSYASLMSHFQSADEAVVKAAVAFMATLCALGVSLAFSVGGDKELKKADH